MFLPFSVVPELILPIIAKKFLLRYKYDEICSFGPRGHFMAIGDGPEEERAAAEMGWPFIKVTPIPSQGPSEPGQDGGDAPRSGSWRIHDLNAPSLLHDCCRARQT